MLHPTIDELTKGEYNRYELVIAAAKCARMVTDEYVRQREMAEREVSGNMDADKSIVNMIDKEYRDEKAVRVAINHLYSGDFYVTNTVEHPDSEKEVAPVAKEEPKQSGEGEGA